MIEIIKNYGKGIALENNQETSPLSDSEIKKLAILNAKLNLQLDPEELQSLTGLRMILLEFVNKKWTIYNIHDQLEISLWSLGVICLKLRGCYDFLNNPFGKYGINKEIFLPRRISLGSYKR